MPPPIGSRMIWLTSPPRTTGRGRALWRGELTKLHEEVWRGSLDEAVEEWAGRDRVRGEVTVVLGAQEASAPDLDAAIAATHALIAAGLSPSEAVRRTAAETGVSRRSLYQRG